MAVLVCKPVQWFAWLFVLFAVNFAVMLSLSLSGENCLLGRSKDSVLFSHSIICCVMDVVVALFRTWVSGDRLLGVGQEGFPLVLIY